MVSDSQCVGARTVYFVVPFEYVCVFHDMHASWLTDDRAALGVSWELIIEDAKEHGEAEHQSDFKTVAFAASHWQGKADHVSQDEKKTGQQ